MSCFGVQQVTVQLIIRLRVLFPAEPTLRWLWCTANLQWRRHAGTAASDICGDQHPACCRQAVWPSESPALLHPMCTLLAHCLQYRSYTSLLQTLVISGV